MGITPEDTREIFPRSKALQTIGAYVTGHSLKNATHATYLYASVPLDDPMVNTTTLAYRAIAEIVLAKRFPNTRFRIKRLNNQFYTSFEAYAKEMPSKFSLRDAETESWRPCPLSNVELQAELMEAYYSVSSKIHTLIVWTALQMVIAPCLESLLVMDRALYVSEHPGVTCDIVPLFDPVTSPRNLALVVRRRASKSD